MACYINVFAQISAITTKDFSGIGEPSTLISDHYFKKGDEVIIHAYKKKSDNHYFLVETEYYANIIESPDVPFNVDIKDLKRLPNALSSKCEELRLELTQKVLDKKRKLALNGLITTVISGKTSFANEKFSKGEIIAGDTIHILGYHVIKGSYDYIRYYALYSNNAAGIYRLTSGRLHNVDVSNIPSINDEQVLNILQKKIEALTKKEEAIYNNYQNEALRGNIKIVVNNPKRLKNSNYEDSPFAIDDTLSIVGFSKENGKQQYALYSNKGAGIFEVWDDRYSELPFKNTDTIKFSYLPNVDNDLVKNVISKKRERVDSLLHEKEKVLENELLDARKSIIKSLQQLSPVVIKDISWSMNSVGGITMNLEVTNCSLQTIKYITFYGYFENPVGDKCRNEIGGGSSWKLQGVGPIGPRPTSLENFVDRFNECIVTFNFDSPFFYSRLAESLYISSVTIQYMNGKSITISGKNIDKYVRY